jgi:NTP pyrophosphatase (non-canonical NTP hydrolase)
MEFNHYQDEAKTFARYPDSGSNIVYPALGLCGEAGEVGNQVKKVLRDDDGVVTSERREKLIDEMGDVLWYIALLADECGIPMEALVSVNLRKLRRRVAQDQIQGDRRERVESGGREYYG